MNCIQKINKKIKTKKNERKFQNTTTYPSGFSKIQTERCDKHLFINSPEFDDTGGSVNGSCCETLSGSIILE